MTRNRQKITTFLMFKDRAEEAAKFYVSIFPNSKITSLMGSGEGTPGRKGSAMGATFQLDGQEFMAYNGGPTFNFAEGISLYVDCETQDEIDRFWKELSQGGEKGRCGWLKDKFGVSWQIVPSVLGEMLNGKDAERSKRAMEAMLKMDKLDIKTLKLAYGKP
jgi:predicted 3-demethylubiquinone-9 3-methyltransferase (glyoxalase superfamily)